MPDPLIVSASLESVTSRVAPETVIDLSMVAALPKTPEMTTTYGVSI